MGLFFTLLYVFGAFMSAETIYGTFAQYHLQVLIAVLALTFGLFQSSAPEVLKLPQSKALAGLICAVVLSLIVNLFFGLAFDSIFSFLPNAISFYFIALACKKKSHVQWVVLAALFAAVYDIGNGLLTLRSGDPTMSPFFYADHQDGTTDLIFRLRGLGLLNDPNDFAQFLVALIPLMFFFWKKGRFALNLPLVYVPTGFLVYGLYLTRSRGGMVALLVACVVAGRRKIGLIPALIGSGVLFLGLTALRFTGGRSISTSSGEDRADAWSTGLQLFKGHPILGVGYSRFGEFYNITAHNTVVVCAAEIGFVGLFLWIFFVLTSVQDVHAVGLDPARQKVKSKLPPLPQGMPAPAMALQEPAFAGQAAALTGMRFSATGSGNLPPWALEPEPAEDPGLSPFAPVASAFDLEEDPETKASKDAEIRQLGALMLVSLSGFLTAAWFLSRAFQMVLYVLAGLAAAIALMARRRGLVGPPELFGRTAKKAAQLSVFLLVVVYLYLRIDHFLPK